MVLGPAGHLRVLQLPERHGQRSTRLCLSPRGRRRSGDHQRPGAVRGDLRRVHHRSRVFHGAVDLHHAAVPVRCGHRSITPLSTAFLPGQSVAGETAYFETAHFDQHGDLWAAESLTDFTPGGNIVEYSADRSTADCPRVPAGRGHGGGRLGALLPSGPDLAHLPLVRRRPLDHRGHGHRRPLLCQYLGHPAPGSAGASTVVVIGLGHPHRLRLRHQFAGRSERRAHRVPDRGPSIPPLATSGSPSSRWRARPPATRVTSPATLPRPRRTSGCYGSTSDNSEAEPRSL